MHAYALALMGLAVFAPPALASGTCLVQVDGQRYLDGPCDVRTGRRAIFFDRHGGDRLTVAIVRQEATPDRGEAERGDPAGWRDRLARCTARAPAGSATASKSAPRASVD